MSQKKCSVIDGLGVDCDDYESKMNVKEQEDVVERLLGND
jgi:hypothetical protein